VEWERRGARLRDSPFAQRNNNQLVEKIMAKAKLAPVSNESEDPFTVIKTHALLLFMVEDQLRQSVRETTQGATADLDRQNHDSDS
jgi:hypothetical protein